MKLRFCLALLLLTVLGLTAMSVYADQQTVFEGDRDIRTQGFTPDQVEHLGNTEKFTFQVRNFNGFARCQYSFYEYTNAQSNCRRPRYPS